jgi:hypothetical protein
MDLYLCDFDRCDTLVLILYGDVIFSIGCPWTTHDVVSIDFGP